MVLAAAILLPLLVSCRGRTDTPYMPDDSQTDEGVYALYELPPPEPVYIFENLEPCFIDELIDGMSLFEQVSQLFILSFDFAEPSGGLENFVTQSRAGGYILFGDNVTTVEGTRALTDALREFSEIAPFVGIDEEGGTVSRLAGRIPGYSRGPSAREIGDTGDMLKAYRAGAAIGEMLYAVGVNVNFAPVADVLTNPRNTVIGSRSFGSEPEVVSDMVSAFQAGLHDSGIMSAPKHFPGHGSTAEDSHFGYAFMQSDPDELNNVEYMPFIRAINEGAEFIMTGHIIMLEKDELPATLSRYFITDVLRNRLGFRGIIITDAMNMGAIAQSYGSAEAAVMALQAGVDMILMPENFNDARDGILQAIEDGVIPPERIRESLERILRTKLAAGLISPPD